MYLNRGLETCRARHTAQGVPGLCKSMDLERRIQLDKATSIRNPSETFKNRQPFLSTSFIMMFYFQNLSSTLQYVSEQRPRNLLC